MNFRLPYDRRHIPVEIDDRNIAGSLVSKVESYKPGLSEHELVEASLDHPIGSLRLEELAKNKKNIVIISSDHTRPVPSKIITPILLRRIRAAQPDANITILVATGFHRPSTHQELIDKYGQEIVDHEQIVMHVSTDDAAMAKIGTLPSGGECIVNRVAVDADLLIAQGFIEAHLLPVSPEAGNLCSPESLLIRPFWPTTAVSLLIPPRPVRESSRVIPFTRTCCMRQKLLD